MKKKDLKLLLHSFDKELKSGDQKLLDEALEKSAELREQKESIIKMRNAISNTKTEVFKPFFAERVMSKIYSLEKPSSKDIEFESLFSIFRPVAVSAVVLIIMFISYNWFSNGQLPEEIAFNESDISIVDAFDPMIELIEE